MGHYSGSPDITMGTFIDDTGNTYRLVNKGDGWIVTLQTAGSNAVNLIGEWRYPSQEAAYNFLLTNLTFTPKMTILPALDYNLELQKIAAAEAANQLALKTSMLQNETATWQSQDAYNTALMNTNMGIDVFNNVTLPALAEKTALTEQVLNSQTATAQPIKPDNIELIILVAIVLLMFFFIIKR